VHWDDLRYLEALTRHGSATAAAREIGVAVSTVYRRLGALEESLGGPVVVKGAELVDVIPVRPRGFCPRVARLVHRGKSRIRISFAGARRRNNLQKKQKVDVTNYG